MKFLTLIVRVPIHITMFAMTIGIPPFFRCVYHLIVFFVHHFFLDHVLYWNVNQYRYPSYFPSLCFSHHKATIVFIYGWKFLQGTSPSLQTLWEIYPTWCPTSWIQKCILALLVPTLPKGTANSRVYGVCSYSDRIVTWIILWIPLIS